METIYLIAAFGFFVAAFIYGLLVLLVWQKSVKAEEDWIFLFAMAALAVWCLNNALVSSFGTVLEKPHTTFGWVLLLTGYPLLYIVPPAIRHTMVLSQLSTTGWRKWGSLLLNYLPLVPMVIHLQVSSRPLPEHYGPAFSGLLFLYLPLTIFEVRRRAELQTRYAQKPGLRLVMWVGLGGALLLACIPPFVCRLFPAQTDLISLIPKFGALPPALAIGYGVLRYRFMDIVLKRSLLYSVLSGLLLGCYLVLVNYGAERLFPEEGLHSVAFDLFFIVMLIFVFQPLKEGLQKSIDHLFFRRHLESAEVLRDFSRTLPTWSDLTGLCRSFVEKVTDSLGLSSGAILFADGAVHSSGNTMFLESIHPFLHYPYPRAVVAEELAEGPLKSTCRKTDIGLIVTLPCREQRGWILLGEKRSGEPFLSEETTLIEAVCGQLATAIDNLFLIQAKVSLERDMQHRDKLAAIGQLAASVAHEIRNPITGAKCLLQQVEEELHGTPQAGEYVQLALEDLDRVEQSITQLLTFARKEEYQFAEQDVSELVRATVDRFAVQVQEKGISVQLHNGVPQLATIDGDKIRRTLLNLLTNALDAVSESGTIAVSVSAAGPEVEVRVSDTGPGLACEDQSRIFEPFFTRKEKGTGLGLALAKKIVEGHGGRISVASTPGQGTTFILTLPRQRPEVKVAA